MDDVHIRGRRGSLHFIRFPTSEMGNFLSLAKSKGMAQLVTTVCATGGGAYKFEQNFKDVSFQFRMEHTLFDRFAFANGFMALRNIIKIVAFHVVKQYQPFCFHDYYVQNGELIDYHRM